MEPQLLAISHTDPLWLAIAFLFGLAVRATGLPSLVGFLVAGFILNGLGAESGEFLDAIADLGITLLLFSIGLKLKLESLIRPEVWGVASIHMGATTLLAALFTKVLSYSAIPLLSEVSWPTVLLIGFALSFSSTVFAVKVLDELGASGSVHGRITIGVLVIQDIAAVLYIALSMGKVPSPYAFALLALIPFRFIIYIMLDKVGHGELLILFGITLALVGADLFELVGIKADVGALIFGMLLAKHPKANELAKALLGFKELFLVGFFVSIGMSAMPGINEIIIALLFLLFLPIKTGLYLGLFNLFRLRTNTSWRTAFNLANYSEFGLIVGAIASNAGFLPKEWLAVFAITMTFSFIFSAFLNKYRDELFQSFHPKIQSMERQKRLPFEESLELKHIKVAVFGMGRMGTAAYSSMEPDYKGEIVGIEVAPEKAEKLNQEGLHVVCGDGTSPDFWSRAPLLLEDLEWVLLTLPTQKANTDAAIELRNLNYNGRIAAVAKYADQEAKLKELGADYTFNIYTEAGRGFANELKILTNNSSA